MVFRSPTETELKLCLGTFVSGALFGLYLLGVPKIASAFSIDPFIGYGLTIIPWAIITVLVEKSFKAKRKDYTLMGNILWLIPAFQGFFFIDLLLNLLSRSV